ncbi:MAG: hypothetical protein FWD28_10410 [Treponema sp.]|nr:hypothetical protein [Treponema sp.]
MKKTLKLVGFIALVAVIGFSMIACDNNPGSGGTYTVSIAMISDSSFGTQFTPLTAPATGNNVQITTGNISDWNLKLAAGSATSLAGNTGLSYSQMNTFFQGYADNDLNQFSDTNKTWLLNRLNSNGEAAIAIFWNAGNTAVFLVAKE